MRPGPNAIVAAGPRPPSGPATRWLEDQAQSGRRNQGAWGIRVQFGLLASSPTRARARAEGAQGPKRFRAKRASGACRRPEEREERFGDSYKVCGWRVAGGEWRVASFFGILLPLRTAVSSRYNYRRFFLRFLVLRREEEAAVAAAGTGARFLLRPCWAFIRRRASAGGAVSPARSLFM